MKMTTTLSVFASLLACMTFSKAEAAPQPYMVADPSSGYYNSDTPIRVDFHNHNARYGNPYIYGYYPNQVHANAYVHTVPAYTTTTDLHLANKTWDGLPVYYSETRRVAAAMPSTVVGPYQPVAYAQPYAYEQPSYYSLPVVYNYHDIGTPSYAYNMGTLAQRERMWINQVIEQTAAGDRIQWNIDNFEYQFRADNYAYRDSSTWRTCRQGALMRRASSLNDWEVQQGNFCRDNLGDWNYVSY